MKYYERRNIVFYPTHSDHLRQLRDADLIVAAEGRPHLRPPRLRKRWLRSMLANRQATHLNPSFELCSGLGGRGLRRLEDHLDITELEAGTSLGVQNRLVEKFVLVLTGEVGVSIDGNVVAVLGAGNHFGERALLNGHPLTWQASFTALSQVTVAVARRDAFMQIVADFPSVAEQVREVAALRGAYITGRADAKAEAAYPIDHHYAEVAR